MSYTANSIPALSLNLYQEYINIAKYYINSKQTSTPIRYFNIDINLSKYDEDSLMVFNEFKQNLNGLVYNLYEMCPAQYTSPALFMTSFEMDKDFSRFSSVFSIIIHSIDKVYIGDLVQFYSFENTTKNLFYRVVNYRVPLYTFENLPIYEVDLEPAPLDVKVNEDGTIELPIRINKRYIYDYSKEEFVPLESYVNKEIVIKFLQDVYSKFINDRIDVNECLIFIDKGTKLTDDMLYKPCYEINKMYYMKINMINKKYSHLPFLKVNFGYKFYLLNFISEDDFSYDYIYVNSNGIKSARFLNANLMKIENYDLYAPNIDFEKLYSQLIENQKLDIYTLLDNDFERLLFLLFLLDKVI